VTWQTLMTQLQMELMSNGTVTIPPELYAKLGWQAGEKLIVQLEDGEVKIFSQAQAIARAQEWVASFVPVDASLADELIAERRQKALGE
jgi:bifunctional DNA-binding transcriptional regulator/antitoxin component of YhaV-PrlF toxin-antitoxin module